MNQKEGGVEYLLVDTTSVNDDAVAAGVAWLRDHDGGCILTPERQVMWNVLQVRTDGEFKKKEDALSRSGISLAWKRRGVPRGARSLVAVYMDKTVDEEIRYGDFERVFLIPWTEGESNWFKTAYNPIIVTVDENGELAQDDCQPVYASVKDEVPESQDGILQFLAQEAAVYDNQMQWREYERFKADLMNYRSEWIQVDPESVFHRCVELGMSAKDADKISGMVKLLREGHRFRPKGGFEEGFRH